MIYFVQRANGDIKIGFTDDFKSRFPKLVNQYGYLFALGFMTGRRRDEGLLHRRFDFCRVEGEWFSQNDILINFILEHGRPHPAKRGGRKQSLRNNLAWFMEMDGVDTYTVAHDTGLTVSEVNNLYQHKTWFYDTASIEKLCRYFRCEVDEFFYIAKVAA